MEKDNSCQVHGSTLQGSMVISNPQPSVLHPFGETSSFEVLMSFKLKTFCYITSTYLPQHFIPMHLNSHYVNSVQVHENNDIYFRFFLPLLYQSRALKNYPCTLLPWWQLMSTVPNLLVVYYLPYIGSSFSAERVMLLSVDVLRLNRVITCEVLRSFP